MYPYLNSGDWVISEELSQGALCKEKQSKKL